MSDQVYQQVFEMHVQRQRAVFAEIERLLEEARSITAELQRLHEEQQQQAAQKGPVQA